MKRKRTDKESKSSEEPPAKKPRLQEKFYLESELVFGDEKTAVIILRTTATLQGFYLSVENPYFEYLHFVYYDDDSEIENKEICFSILRNLLRGEIDKRSRGLKYFFAKLDKDGNLNDMCDKPTDHLFFFVIELKYLIDEEEKSVCLPLTPKRNRETEIFLESRVKELEDEIGRLQDMVEDLQEQKSSKE